MQRRSSFWLTALAAALLLSGSGCGSGKPKLYKVTGKVTLDGQPLSGATVQFVPADPATGLEIARGSSGTDGVYNLTTYNTNDGAMEGNYKVIVTKSVKVEVASGESSGPGGMDPSKMKEMFAKNMAESFSRKTKVPPKSETEIHREYSNFDTTPLQAKVNAGANTIDLPLRKGGGT